MGRRTVTVTTTKVVEVEIRDASLTPEALKEFSQTIYKVDTPDELFKHAAEQASRIDNPFVLEGVGTAMPQNTQWGAADEKYPVAFRIVDEDMESEVRP